MGKIFYIIGKSASGKDTILSRLLEDPEVDAKGIVQTTTRPMRDGEQEGREYFFISDETLLKLKEEGKVIEERVYHTVYGDWHYLLADNGSISLQADNYMAVGTIESYVQVRNYFKEENVIPMFVYVESGERLQRALNRERTHDNPKYTEMCRRFIADEQDFDDAHMMAAGLMDENHQIRNCFENIEISTCIEEMKKFYLENK